MIVQLKNAGNAGLDHASFPFSKIKENILLVLKENDFIKDFKVITSKGKKVLSVSLLLEDRTPRIQGVRRISKTSKRVYQKANEIRAIKSGYGLLVLSTPEGVMSGKDAKKNKVGGEALFSIW